MTGTVLRWTASFDLYQQVVGCRSWLLPRSTARRSFLKTSQCANPRTVACMSVCAMIHLEQWTSCASSCRPTCRRATHEQHAPLAVGHRSGNQRRVRSRRALLVSQRMLLGPRLCTSRSDDDRPPRRQGRHSGKPPHLGIEVPKSPAISRQPRPYLRPGGEWRT